MDLPSVAPGELAAVATRLERYAARLDACATQVRVATPVSWDGPAARLHRERVGEHADDLVALAHRVRASALLVRELQAVAESRLHLVGQVDLTVGIRP